jgi:hypothetical protein
VTWAEKGPGLQAPVVCCNLLRAMKMSESLFRGAIRTRDKVWSVIRDAGDVACVKADGAPSEQARKNSQKRLC